MPRPVTVQFLKNPNLLHWGFETTWIGEDEWGDWMAVPAGSTRWKGTDEVRPTRHPAVFCAPRDGWWHLHYNGATTEYSHFVDIITPVRWVDTNHYEMIDLDLDVIRRQNGNVEIEDEDEFAVHQVDLAYTQEMIDNAIAETDRLVTALQTGQEPFFDVAAHWLARVG